MSAGTAVQIQFNAAQAAFRALDLLVQKRSLYRCTSAVSAVLLPAHTGHISDVRLQILQSLKRILGTHQPMLISLQRCQAEALQSCITCSTLVERTRPQRQIW